MISEGSKVDMDAWKSADVMEFFRGLTLHQEKAAAILSKMKGHVRGKA